MIPSRSPAPRRSVVSKWEIERDVQAAEARRAQDEQRARERDALYERALNSARKRGATGHWFAHWRLVGLTAEELVEIRAEVTLGGAP